MDQALASTATLIHRIQGGEDEARELLVQRCLGPLRRWAHGRLPAYGRSLSETDDMIQVTLMRAMGRIEQFRPERQGAFLAYLRQALMNTIRNELRTVSRRPVTEALETDEREPVDPADLEQAAGELEAYEKGLATLSERPRQALILRVEFGLTFQEIAAELEIASADAARMTVNRSLVAVARAMS